MEENHIQQIHDLHLHHDNFIINGSVQHIQQRFNNFRANSMRDFRIQQIYHQKQKLASIRIYR